MSEYLLWRDRRNCWTDTDRNLRFLEQEIELAVDNATRGSVIVKAGTTTGEYLLWTRDEDPNWEGYQFERAFLCDDIDTAVDHAVYDDDLQQCLAEWHRNGWKIDITMEEILR